MRWILRLPTVLAAALLFATPVVAAEKVPSLRVSEYLSNPPAHVSTEPARPVPIIALPDQPTTLPVLDDRDVR